MHLKNLHLRSFRNFTDQSFDFGAHFNVLVGDNAQGKTNVLEAIAFLAHGRSFRTSEWRDLIEHGRGRASVSAHLIRERGEDEVDVYLEEPRKRFRKNGKNTRPGGIEGMQAILFAPEEILLLRTLPSVRRKCIDRFISSLHGPHRKNTRDYESIVSQRNKILSDEKSSIRDKERLLQPWDDQLIMAAARIIVERKRWCDRINEMLPVHYATIAKRDERAAYRYQPQVGANVLSDGAEGIARAMTEMLSKRRTDELIRKTTLVGPHRDDLVAHIGDNVVKRFASQGQHRSFVLSLKLAEMDVVQGVTGETPLFLLDDVASELDPERNRCFFTYLRQARGQVFITTTRARDVKLDADDNILTFVIQRGKLKRNSP